MKNQVSLYRRGLFFLFSGMVVLPALAQTQQEVPLIKSTRTSTYKAVLKDTAWTAGPIVAQIHFVRYDNQGRKVVENLLNPDGSAKNKLLYIYDNDGKIKEEITASVKQGGVTRVYQYDYDGEGRLNRKVTLDADRNVVGETVILRNENDKIVKRISEGISTRMNDGKKTKNRCVTEIVYDEDGRIKEVMEDDSAFPKVGKKSRPFDKRDTVALKRFSEGSSMQPKVPKNRKVDFDYDACGNWIKRTEYDGVNPEFIIVRTIDYAGQDTDWEKMLLNGQVKSVSQTSYVAIPKGPGSIDKGKKQGTFFRCEFNNEGRKILDQSYSDIGVAGEITEYNYDEEGNILEEIRKSATGKLLNTVRWAYDSKGHLKSKSLQDINGEVLRKGVFRYDIEGNCISEMWFSKEGTKFSEFRYKYDSAGQLIAKDVLFHQEAGEEYEPLKYEWNSRGRIAEEWRGLPQNVQHYTYKYSVRGEVISGTEPVQGQADVEYVYKFYNDEHGNWKKRVKFFNDVPVLYEEREYVYYK